MGIIEYLNMLDGKGKRHVLIVATPKGSYPTQFSREEYFNLENSILKEPTSYIDLFEQDVPEIMQFTAFRLFLKPLICDNKQLFKGSISRVNRLEKEQIVSFIVAKHFYDTVPSSKLTEELAIKEGLDIAGQLLEKYPLANYEFASVALDKDSDEANTLIKIEFMNKNDNYYFDYVYVY